jgi:hypothetical protein
VSGNRLLAVAAQENAKGWKFVRCVPFRTDGTRQDDSVDLVYEFRLLDATKSAPKVRFSYEQGAGVTVTSEVPTGCREPVLLAVGRGKALDGVSLARRSDHFGANSDFTAYSQSIYANGSDFDWLDNPGLAMRGLTIVAGI